MIHKNGKEVEFNKYQDMIDYVELIQFKDMDHSEIAEQQKNTIVQVYIESQYLDNIQKFAIIGYWMSRGFTMSQDINSYQAMNIILKRN